MPASNPFLSCSSATLLASGKCFRPICPFSPAIYSIFGSIIPLSLFLDIHCVPAHCVTRVQVNSFRRAAIAIIGRRLPWIGGNVRGAAGGVRLDQDPRRRRSNAPLGRNRLRGHHHNERECQHTHRRIKRGHERLLGILEPKYDTT